MAVITCATRSQSAASPPPVLVEPPPVHVPSGVEFRAVNETLLAIRRADGLEAARRLTPDVVVTDVRLPDGSGLELVSEITTRFPRDAVRRFTEMADSPEWIDRLTIVGIDLRDPTQVVALTDEVAAAGPLDILINNACQTVRRTPGSYSHLTEGEQAPLVGDELPAQVREDVQRLREGGRTIMVVATDDRVLGVLGLVSSVIFGAVFAWRRRPGQ